MNHTVQVVEVPTQQLVPVEELSPVLGTFQSYQLSESLGMWAGLSCLSEECAVSRIKMGPLKLCFFMYCGRGQVQ